MDDLAIQSFHTKLEETIRLRIDLPGGSRVWISSHLVPDEAGSASSNVQALVNLPALASTHSLHKKELMELLWPEVAIESARNNLRQTLHLARKILISEDNSDFGLLIDQSG